jgi:hypothetical protein
MDNQAELADLKRQLKDEYVELRRTSPDNIKCDFIIDTIEYLEGRISMLEPEDD